MTQFKTPPTMGQNSQELIRNVFDAYKRKSPWNSLICLPVIGANGEAMAFLKPITADYRMTTPDLPDLLGQWRAENPTLSPSIFKITRERTLHWLDHLIIARPDKLLFIIHAIDGTPLGHLGYSNFEFEPQIGEIDSILRGVKSGYPGLMRYAMISLLRWGLSELQLKGIRLSVISDNERAIAFYEKLGFIRTGLKPLVKVSLPDEERWDLAPSDFKGQSEKYFLGMRLDINACPEPVRNAFHTNVKRRIQ